MGCIQQKRRRAQLPTLRGWNGLETFFHLKSCSFIVAPPSRESLDIVVAMKSFMDITTADSARARVQIFVAAPAGEVNVPFVKFQGSIACCMCQIETGNYTNFVSCFCNTWYVEHLAGVIIHSTEHHQR